MKNSSQILSSKENRLKHTPQNRPGRAHWDGPRGNSKYIVESGEPELLNLLQKFGIDGIQYTFAVVDFGPCILITIHMPQMAIQRYKNFAYCDQTCANHWNAINYLGYNNWTRHLVANYRKNNQYTWHERNDRIHCDLVPRKIHSFFCHLGGISECKLAAKQK